MSPENVNLPASGPPFCHVIEAPSGSVARYVPTVSVLPSENVTAVAPDVITGGSFTSVTVTSTVLAGEDSTPS